MFFSKILVRSFGEGVVGPTPKKAIIDIPLLANPAMNRLGLQINEQKSKRRSSKRGKVQTKTPVS